jgi:hypothetical protein
MIVPIAMLGLEPTTRGYEFQSCLRTLINKKVPDKGTLELRGLDSRNVPRGETSDLQVMSSSPVPARISHKARVFDLLSDLRW